MDPLETLRELVAAINCNDRDSAITAADDLADLLSKNCAMPYIELLLPGDDLTNKDICQNNWRI